MRPEYDYIPNFFSAAEARSILTWLTSNIEWQQEKIFIAGQYRTVPRLVAWYGDSAAVYRYSGIDHQPRPWIDKLYDLQQRMEAFAQTQFNSVLLNFYRDGQDSMGWHADDEPELGSEPIIASLSFGAARRFCFKSRDRLHPQKYDLELDHGSCLIMSGNCQKHWLHALPKTAKPIGPRINLTFRWIKSL